MRVRHPVYQQRCERCRGHGHCRLCGEPGLTCEECGGLNRCATCDGAGIVVSEVHSLNWPLSAAAWKRADLFKLRFAKHPDPVRAVKTHRDALLTRPRPLAQLKSLEQTMKVFLPPLADIQLGQVCLAHASSLQARSGNSLFVIEDFSDPFEIRVFEANLIACSYPYWLGGAVVAVHVVNVFPLSGLANRMGELDELQPGEAMGQLFVDGVETHRTEVGALTVVTQSAQEMANFVIFERDGDATRCLLRWAEIGSMKLGVLGSRLMPADF